MQNSNQRGSQFTFIDLFAGIGGIRLAFEAVGGECVFTSEWDNEAQAVYEANFRQRPNGDITQILSDDIPNHDILTAGFPCQPFSIIGQGLGFADTRGTLFFELERILRDKQPPAFLLENVRQLTTHDNKRTLQVILQHLTDLGYYVHWAILNALDFGLPQKRERVFIVGFKENYPFQFPRKMTTRPITLHDILEPESDIISKYISSEEIQRKRQESVKGKNIFYPSIWHENKGGNISIHDFSCALRANASFNYLLVNGRRRLTPREQLRLQGFPESFQLFGTETGIRRLTGNSVAVSVVQAVAAEMLKAMQSREFTYQQLSLLGEN